MAGHMENLFKIGNGINKTGAEAKAKAIKSEMVASQAKKSPRNFGSPMIAEFQARKWGSHPPFIESTENRPRNYG